MNCDTVRTVPVGKDVAWQNGKLTLPFEGNRVDVVLKPGDAAPAQVRIDGKKPSEIPELYTFTRALATPGGKWPVILKLGWEKPRGVGDLDDGGDQRPRQLAAIHLRSDRLQNRCGRRRRFRPALRLEIGPRRHRTCRLERGLLARPARHQAGPRPFYGELAGGSAASRTRSPRPPHWTKPGRRSSRSRRDCRTATIRSRSAAARKPYRCDPLLSPALPTL